MRVFMGLILRPLKMPVKQRDSSATALG